MHAPRVEDGDHPYYGPERRHGSDRRMLESDGIEPVVLTRKLANMIDGIDLAGHRVGDRMPLPSHEAGMLIAEGWARPSRVQERRRGSD